MTDSVVFKIRLMGMNGLYAKTICAKLKKMGAADLTPAQVYRILRLEGISLRAYREGWGEGATEMFKRIGFPGALPEIKRGKRTAKRGKNRHTRRKRQRAAA